MASPFYACGPLLRLKEEANDELGANTEVDSVLSADPAAPSSANVMIAGKPRELVPLRDRRRAGELLDARRGCPR
jgi:hypothetical protein